MHFVKSLTSCVLAGALGIACAPALHAQQASKAHSILVPAKGAYLGAWVYRAPDEKDCAGVAGIADR